MKQEVELKLELSDAAADEFERLPLLPEKSRSVHLHAIYFDTPDHRLAARGMVLRIRRSGARRVQTVKAGQGDGHGLFDRAEWEMPVKDDSPVLDARTPVAAALGDAVATIEPIFNVDVERRTWTLKFDSSQIELALDRGKVIAGDRQLALTEIELELKKGQPAALFDIARRIDAEVPVRLGVLSKPERGYQLLKAPPPAIKSAPITLDTSVTTIQAFTRIAAACLRQYRLNEDLLLDHYDPRALHQARVAIRRLRSALSVFKPILRAEDVDRFQGELRWLARTLGDARDLDVLAERLGPDADGKLETALTGVHATAGKWLRSARVRGTILDIAEWIALGAGQTDGEAQEKRQAPAQGFADKRINRLFRRVKKGGRDMEELSDEARHEVRKTAKKLRYASEFLEELFPAKKQRRRHATFVRTLEKLQDRLGALNDLIGEADLLARHGLESLAEERKGLTPRRKRKLLAAAARAHDNLADAKRFWR